MDLFEFFQARRDAPLGEDLSRALLEATSSGDDELFQRLMADAGIGQADLEDTVKLHKQAVADLEKDLEREKVRRGRPPKGAKKATVSASPRKPGPEASGGAAFRSEFPSVSNRLDYDSQNLDRPQWSDPETGMSGYYYNYTQEPEVDVDQDFAKIDQIRPEDRTGKYSPLTPHERTMAYSAAQRNRGYAGPTFADLHADYPRAAEQFLMGATDLSDRRVKLDPSQGEFVIEPQGMRSDAHPRILFLTSDDDLYLYRGPSEGWVQMSEEELAAQQRGREDWDQAMDSDLTDTSENPYMNQGSFRLSPGQLVGVEQLPQTFGSGKKRFEPRGEKEVTEKDLDDLIRAAGGKGQRKETAPAPKKEKRPEEFGLDDLDALMKELGVEEDK